MEIVFVIVTLVLSVVIHEVAHGTVANALGDPTARLQGRLTLNPLAHLDWMGSVIVPLVMYSLSGFAFGWAKPVPYNPYNLKNQRWGPALVAAAGPLSNLVLVAVFSFVFHMTHNPLTSMAASTVVYINAVLMIFNLFPIPPLDGSRILTSFLPARLESSYNKIFQSYGFVMIIGLVFFGWPVVRSIVNWVVGAFLNI